MKEIFKTHKSGYIVSNKGRIKGKLVEFLSPNCSKAGYLMCSIGLVHRVVVETFIGEIPKDMEVNHIDGVKSNNELSNLEVVTRSENQKHAHKTGLAPCTKGEKNATSVLKEVEVIDIYEMVKSGETNDDIRTNITYTQDMFH